jgi:hypothetical protein
VVSKIFNGKNYQVRLYKSMTRHRMEIIIHVIFGGT